MYPNRGAESNWVAHSTTAPRPISAYPIPTVQNGWPAVSSTFPQSAQQQRDVSVNFRTGGDYDAPVDMTSWAPEYSRSYGDQGTQFQSSYDERVVPSMPVQTQAVDLRFASSPGVSPKELFLFHNFNQQHASFLSSEESAFDDQMDTDEGESDEQQLLLRESWSSTSHLLPGAELTHFEMETDTFDEEDDSDEHSEVSRAAMDEDEPSLNLKDNPFSEVVLPPSKTPCLDALAFCVVMGLGCEIDKTDDSVIFVTDCSKLLAYIKAMCPKANQTNNSEARIKALKRWFNNIPAKKRRLEQFTIDMKSDKKQAIRKILRKMELFCQNENLIPTSASSMFGMT